MAAPRKYPDELRERAIRFALDLVEGPEKLSVNAACKRVGEQLGIVPDSLRNWVQQARVDAGKAPGLSSDERARLAELERENRELRRANAILKSPPRLSSRPSSTGHPSADRLHRPASPGVRGRADLPRAHRGGRRDRSEHVLRRADPAAVGAGGPRRAAQARDSAGLRRQPRRLRSPQGVADPPARRPLRAALPGRAAHARARPGRRGARQGQADHRPGRDGRRPTRPQGWRLPPRRDRQPS